jgi:hypothetical protein
MKKEKNPFHSKSFELFKEPRANMKTSAITNENFNHRLKTANLFKPTTQSIMSGFRLFLEPLSTNKDKTSEPINPFQSIHSFYVKKMTDFGFNGFNYNDTSNQDNGLVSHSEPSLNIELNNRRKPYDDVNDLVLRKKFGLIDGLPEKKLKNSLNTSRSDTTNETSEKINNQTSNNDNNKYEYFKSRKSTSKQPQQQQQQQQSKFFSPSLIIRKYFIIKSKCKLDDVFRLFKLM